jgi:hypothetical protein
MKNINSVYIAFSFLFTGCSFISGIFCKQPDILINKEFTGENIAVLTFARKGMFIYPDIGIMTADKLTDELFLSGKYEIIDRSKVNTAQEELEILNTDVLSRDKIQQLGLMLKADYLILGRISSNPVSENFGLEMDKKMNISFRIISILNTDVVGIVDYTMETTESTTTELDLMIKKIVKTMVLQND